MCPCGYHVFTGSGTCATNTGTDIQVTLSGDIVYADYGFVSRGLCFVFTTATRCAWENNNFDINTRSNNAFKEKDPSLVYLFIFSFIIMHPYVR